MNNDKITGTENLSEVAKVKVEKNPETASSGIGALFLMTTNSPEMKDSDYQIQYISALMLTIRPF